MIEKRKKRIK